MPKSSVSAAPKKRGEAVKLISAHAKDIRKPNEKWTDCIKRASADLRKKGTI